MKKSTAPAPSGEPLPKVVSIESLRARREEASLRADAGAAQTDRAPSSDEPMSESERDRLLEELRSELGDLPDVRLEKVIEARARIARGYYDSERVRLDILGAMLEEERGPLPPEAPAAKPRSATTAKTPAAKKSSGKKRPTRPRTR